jgi:hypothetical protein
MSTISTQGAEPIPGYVLLERIGAGAYGEVWRAIAPGGLAKAVKVVYGYHNELRASRELKSLECVKQLRHPFLLSLERIEIIDNRLIIVTELADMSLKDRFLECCETGAPGIERQELLAHLHDAADALDYIHESQSLQHLDIKSENLLLVGGRLKVADFGLVRNLSQSDNSLLEGMTPRYASPEVFEGRPTKYSDQFSLAVVYAELLTGQPPFSAKSPAQLAAQHLLGAKPNLGLLPADDQVAVARALSKRPEDRFPDCRAFINTLMSGGPKSVVAEGAVCRQAPAVAVAALSPATTAKPAVAGALVDLAAGRDSLRVTFEPTVILADDSELRQLTGLPDNGPDLRRLPPVELGPQEWVARPTVFIGIGGAANQVLCGLRRRCAERFASPENIPAWQMLLIDTDQETLDGMAGSDSADKHPLDNLLHLQLRSTQEYRTSLPRVLTWLSRRWLYNIPRIPRTSGWRPLGRLALVDNAARVMNRLRRVLREFTSPAAIAASAKTTGTEFAGRPVIVLVASLGGGSGSGMVLDLAYAVRKLASELGIGEYHLQGMLLYATDHDPAAQDLARANAFACLTELAHFNRPGGGYPGDESLEIPAAPSIVPTFDETLIAHLGDGLMHAEFAARSEQAADYLYHRLATQGGTVLECVHQLDDARQQAAATGELAVRTFGLYAVNNLGEETVDIFATRLCQLVAEKWLGSRGDKSGANSAGRLGVIDESDALSRQLEDLIGAGLEPRPDRILLRELTEFFADHVRQSSDGYSPAQDESCLSPLRPAVAKKIGADVHQLATALRELGGPVPWGQHLEELAADRTGPDAPLFAIRSALQSFLADRVSELAADLARELPGSFFRSRRHSGSKSESTGQVLEALCRQLRVTARAEINQALKPIDVSRLLIDLTEKSQAARAPVRDLLTAASPRLAGANSVERLFVFVPSYADPEALRRFFVDELQEAASIVQTVDERLTLCFEREQMTVRDIAASLIENKPGYAETASRLHTRVDVQWSPLRLR